MPRIYLDNAATSWPKPEPVLQAMDRFLRECGGAAGRGGHQAAVEAQAVVDRARGAIARLLGVSQSDRIALAFNGTDALNMAIRGVLQPGDHVVTTACEHNSVLRPLRHAQQTMACSVTVVDCDAQGRFSPEAVLQAVQPHTRLVAVTHASNVTGAIQPVEEIAAQLSSPDTLLLVDAAQTAGHLPLDATKLGADLIAASGHKGLLGPTGTGFLYVRPGLEADLSPFRLGGSGSQSEDDQHPTQMPSLFEAGNMNVVGLAGLAAGIEYLEDHGLAAIHAHERELTAQLLTGIQKLPNVTIVGPPTAENRTPVVSVQVKGYDPHEAAAVLEMTAGLQCRAGIHCAARIHQCLNTNAGGTLRLGLGHANTASDIELALQALQNL